jgi:hypothetical protein
LQPGRKWKEKPFHWRTERHGRRISLLADTILGFNLPAICVTAEHVSAGQEEVARVACFESLLLEVLKQGVVGIIIDRRSAGQLKRDRQMMIDFRKRNIFPAGFLYGFVYPSQDAAVWIGDALAGAMYEELAGDLRYTAALGAQLLRLS